MVEWCARHEVEVWAYCLMPNHVHMVAVPGSADGPRRAIGEAHRRYTRHVNFREGWRGHLWQGRFASLPRDGDYLLSTARYVELNPVRARLVERPETWAWSSALPHLKARDHDLAKVAPLRDMVGDWRAFLAGGFGEQDHDIICRHQRTGWPLDDATFVARLETALGRRLKRKKPGPNRREAFSEH